MDIDNLGKFLKDQKPYRIKQAMKAVYQDFVSDWKDVTTLPADLRDKLNKNIPLSIKSEVVESNDKNTVKALIELDDGLKIEAVLMKHKDDRNTVCVSSQIGCPVGCKFCATGQMGFSRNLTVSEIIMQIVFFGRILKKDNTKVTNVVFMGMGEPFLNYDNLMTSIRLLNSEEGFGLGARRMAVSTSGIVPGIEKFKNEDIQVNLAISLHAPNEELRTKLMPINKVYSINKILKSVDKYIIKNSRRVMFEYLMIKDVNDSDKHARELVKLMAKPLYLVNLIKYNETGKFKSSDSKTVSRFMKILLDAGIPTTQRYSYGHEINAACGQLATKRKN